MNAISQVKDDQSRVMQLRLTALNRARLLPRLPEDDIDLGDSEYHLAVAEEDMFLHEARKAVSNDAASAPCDPAHFIAWYEGLTMTGPGQGDSLFPWLEHRATRSEMCWFLAQEVAGEAGFDDLTALTALRMPARPKLELARNFWDEMGRGTERGMHGPMLDRLAKHLHLDLPSEKIVWQAHALANTMAGLAVNRKYAYHSIGALGVVELTAPGRAAMVANGLNRLGVPAQFRHYFALHAVLDIRHSQAWNAEVIRPLIEADRRVAVAIAEGALMRLASGAACFDCYRRTLNVPPIY